MNDSTQAKLVQLILLPVLFYLGGKASLASAALPEVLVMFWIPNSFLLAALFHYGFRRYTYFAGTIILAEIAVDYPTFTLIEATLFGVVNLSEVTLAYVLMRRSRFDPRLATPSDLAKFIAAGPLSGALIAAFAAGAIYSYFRATETGYFELVRVWWFSDATGLMLFTPLVLSMWPPVRGAPSTTKPLRWYDAIAAIGALGALAVLAMSDRGILYNFHVRPVLLLPFALYAAVRLPVPATTVVLALFSGVILFVTKNGQQPFGQLSTHETVLLVQEFLFIMTASTLGLATLLSQLRANTLELEARVHQRTAELRDANRQLERLAATDPLTGVLNRRALLALLRHEMERARRHGHDIAVIMLDVDHFKDINDRHGHTAGDIVLQHITAVAEQIIRDADTMARYGGEEFVLVAPETDKTAAMQLAERIRVALRSTQAPLNGLAVRVTASFGVAALDPLDKNPEDVLRRADQALYAAKARGRDRVVADASTSAL